MATTEVTPKNRIELPASIQELVNKFQDAVLIAGGFALAMARYETDSFVPSDIDIFVRLDKASEISAFLEANDWKLGKVTQFARSYSSKYSQYDVQIIEVPGEFRGIQDVEQIFNGFDLDACQVALSGADLVMTFQAKYAIEEGVIGINKLEYPLLTAQRLLKYQGRGFDVNGAMHNLVLEVASKGIQKSRETTDENYAFIGILSRMGNAIESKRYSERGDESSLSINRDDYIF